MKVFVSKYIYPDPPKQHILGGGKVGAIPGEIFADFFSLPPFVDVCCMPNLAQDSNPC